MSRATLTRAQAHDIVDDYAASSEAGMLTKLAAAWDMAGSWNVNADFDADDLHEFVNESADLRRDGRDGANPSDDDDTGLSLPAPSVEELAHEFARQLRECIGLDNLCNVNRRNARNAGDVCASHDYCDANMVMCDAFRELCGRMPDIGDATSGDGPLWCAAWSMAKAANFYVPSWRWAVLTDGENVWREDAGAHNPEGTPVLFATRREARDALREHQADYRAAAGLGIAMPEGFEEISTGGNCTAWHKPIGALHHVLVTASNDCRAPTGWPVDVGLYHNDDSDGGKLWENVTRAQFADIIAEAVALVGNGPAAEPPPYELAAQLVAQTREHAEWLHDFLQRWDRSAVRLTLADELRDYCAVHGLDWIDALRAGARVTL